MDTIKSNNDRMHQDQHLASDGTRRPSLLFLPLVDFTAIVFLLTSVIYACAFVYQLPTFLRFGIPISEMEFPTTEIALTGMFVLVIIMYSTSIGLKYHRKRLSADKGQLASVLLGALLFAMFIVALMRSTDVLSRAYAIVFGMLSGILLFGLPPCLRQSQKKRYQTLRDDYYFYQQFKDDNYVALEQSLRLSKRRKSNSAKYVQIRRERRISNKRKTLLSAIEKTIGTAPFYVPVVAVMLASVSYFFGAWRANLVNSFPLLKDTNGIIVVLYQDRAIVACLDKASGTTMGFKILAGHEVDNIETSPIVVAKKTDFAPRQCEFEAKYSPEAAPK